MDPKCAMCWWGLAQAEGIRAEGTHGVRQRRLAEAMRLKDHASARTSSISRRRRRGAAKGEDNKQQVAILRRLVKKPRSDTQAKIFLAGGCWRRVRRQGRAEAGERNASRFLKACWGLRPTIRRQTTTGSMPWSRESSGAGVEECRAAGQPGAELRTHGAHAGAHFLSHGKLC